jgi:hypothetical protein
MKQTERMNSASNRWEPDPWDATDEVADHQLAGFEIRACRKLDWLSLDSAPEVLFGYERSKLRALDVEYFATANGEDMMLLHLVWHGFPDPPEWRLASRESGANGLQWETWGYFAEIPELWSLPGLND